MSFTSYSRCRSKGSRRGLINRKMKDPCRLLLRLLKRRKFKARRLDSGRHVEARLIWSCWELAGVLPAHCEPGHSPKIPRRQEQILIECLQSEPISGKDTQAGWPLSSRRSRQVLADYWTENYAASLATLHLRHLRKLGPYSDRTCTLSGETIYEQNKSQTPSLKLRKPK